MTTWLIGAVAGLAALIGAFFYGRSAGIDHERAIQAKAMVKATAVMRKAEDSIDVQAGLLAVAQRDQSTQFRTIYHEATRIIERQSKSVCVTSDGLILFDRARANANRTLARLPYDIPAGASADAPQ